MAAPLDTAATNSQVPANASDPQAQAFLGQILAGLNPPAGTTSTTPTIPPAVLIGGGILLLLLLLK